MSEICPSQGKVVAPHARAVPAPDGYRQEGDVGARFAAGVQAAIDDLAAHGIRPAALICDMIFGSDGVFTDPPGFMTEAVARVRAAGGLFIADEVQPGFGRTGTHMWGFQRHGLVPDAVILGKPAGNGLPLAGLVAQPRVLEAFAAQSRYFNTFGGNPVCCAAGLAVLEVIRREGLMENAVRVGARMRAGMEELATAYPVLGDIRGNLDRTHDKDVCQPALRVGERQELGWAATFLASPYGRFISGHTLVVDGANWQRRSMTNPEVVTIRDQMGRPPFEP